ncbi:isoleucine--tRNA ligase [Lujinxingia litoralis]|uniref:Isoleucine--tRNA ligase n=1 Tax=Lujinxingia litoralis TaxID=2211119 RepID=A0A328C969_9DELT|nr:isoleucine--tRNA ligase [Lujinxingia litoralis]RAL22183.1 isoleucine--tRNA ligase [Lujinxingia litoralis]
MGKDFKDTLNLPSTDFPMRANLAGREEARVSWWQDEGIYQAWVERGKAEGWPRFILHDGPPYANGTLHHGHILNKTLKDFVVKFRNMAGELCEYVPGWDCHGLPIEHQVDKELGKKKREMTKVEIRQACREYAQRFVDIQRTEFQRVMGFGQWDDPYLTMSYDYEATTVRELGRFFEKGIVYRGFKPVHWDWAAQTALAEAEVEYDAFTTEHVYAKFPFEELPEALRARVGERQTFAVIWTTTPWTLPANLAIALNPDLTYQLVAVGDEVYLMAEGRREQVLKDCRIEESEVLASFEGRELVGELGEGRGLKARHPWLERDSVLLPADYVTLEQGTGCVHTAPGHGQEDFELGRQFGLGILCPVDEYGKFRGAEVEEFVGTQVFKANPVIQQKLADLGMLLNAPGDKVTIDRYPHGWRSKKPVIFRATEQWFVAMEPQAAGLEEGFELRKAALEEIEKINWVPQWGRDRIHGMVVGRPDWCISRQRSWGVPITVMYCRACNEALATREIADHVADLVEDHGADVWFERDASELVPAGTVCPACGGDDFRKEEDILDVWFDSGVSWSAVLDRKLGIGTQADLYLEGSDQHRGWFQSSLLACLTSRGHSPYKTCLTHGFVTDEDGRKYSKSSKNFEPPQRMIDQYGAEILRLWVSAVDYRGDITLSTEILKRVSDAYRKVRNTFRFLLGGLEGFEPGEALALSELEEIDRWVLHRTAEVLERIEEAYRGYQFHTIYHTLVHFVTVDLSNVYMDVTKDRMYCEAPGSRERLSGQTAYWLVIDALVRALAPILSFTCEEAWEHLPHGEDAEKSVFLAGFPTHTAAWKDAALGERWERLLEVRQEVQKAMEEKRARKKGERKEGQIGSSQEAHVTVGASGETLSLVRSYEEQLPALFIASEVVIEEAAPSEGKIVEVGVVPASGQKCPRCWNFWIQPGSDAEVCPRCAHVLEVIEG